MKEHSEPEIDLLYFFAILYKKKISFLIILVIFWVAFYAAYVIMTPLYRVQVTLLPTENTSSNMSALSGLLSLTGIAANNSTSQTDKLIAILNSRSLAERVILKNKDLVFRELYPEQWHDGKWISKADEGEPRIQDVASRVIDASIKVTFELPLITLEVTSTNAILAKKIADDYLVEAQNIINSSDLSIAERNRDFLAEQLKKIKSDVLIGKQSIINYYSGEKSNVNGAGQIINDLILEQAAGHKLSASVYLGYLEDMQDILKQTNISLEKSYELAKVEADREKLGFTVMDSAYVPLKPYFPNFVIFTILAIVGASFSFLTYCLMHLCWKLRKNNWPELVKKV